MLMLDGVWTFNWSEGVRMNYYNSVFNMMSM